MAELNDGRRAEPRGGTIPEGSAALPESCCTADVATNCCESAEKADCCGDTTAGVSRRCGCE